jgi:hypothetical protein
MDPKKYLTVPTNFARRFFTSLSTRFADTAGHINTRPPTAGTAFNRSPLTLIAFVFISDLQKNPGVATPFA